VRIFVARAVLRHGPFDILGGGGLGFLSGQDYFFSPRTGANFFFPAKLEQGNFFNKVMRILRMFVFYQ